MGRVAAQRFADRDAAGRELGMRVAGLGLADPLVVAMPRGGVPVARHVARALGAPLDIVVVRKLGAPRQPEYAIGAIAEGGRPLVNHDDPALADVPAETIAALIGREQEELVRRAAVYRAVCPQREVAGRDIVLVDDGLATGASAAAAARALKERGAARVVMAAPVCARESVARPPDPAIDEVVCLHTPDPFFGVGLWYGDFSQVSDAEVVEQLRAARDPAAVERADLEIVLGGGVRLGGTLCEPVGAVGVVVFAHGSGSSAASPRNQMVAARLRDAGLATLLFDLLTPDEAADRQNVFDVALLAARLEAACATVASRRAPGDLRLGLFGASTGAAAALVAAANLGDRVAAVVSRGGRPDLAGARLAEVTAPTLLIVGGADEAVLDLNRAALAALRCPAELEIVAGATHLFAEPGALERVADLAAAWFARLLLAENR